MVRQSKSKFGRQRDLPPSVPAGQAPEQPILHSYLWPPGQELAVGQPMFATQLEPLVGLAVFAYERRALKARLATEN